MTHLCVTITINEVRDGECFSLFDSMVIGSSPHTYFMSVIVAALGVCPTQQDAPLSISPHQFRFVSLAYTHRITFVTSNE